MKLASTPNALAARSISWTGVPSGTPFNAARAIFAGFSGGAKMVAPGLAGLKTVLVLHDAKRIGSPNATWGVIEGNPVQDDVREIARTTRSHFLSINHEAETPIGASTTRTLVVGDVVREAGGFERLYRSPCWVRAGYVEELYRCPA